MNLAQLRALFDKLGTEIRELIQGAENGVLTEEQRTQQKELAEKRAGVLDQIETLLELQEQERTLPGDAPDPDAATDPNETRGIDARVTGDREAERRFDSLGEQMVAVRAAAQEGATPDKRLLRIQDEARAAGMSEAVASDGGFLIEPQLETDMRTAMFETGSILSRVTRTPIGPNSNGLKLRQIKEDSRADGSRHGGVRGYWTEEGGAITDSKLEFERPELRLNKVAALMYATQELLEDAVALESEIGRVVPLELRFLVEDAIVNGSGHGKPLGFKTVDAYVEIAKEGSQAADTVVAENVANQRARLLPGSMANAAWLIDHSVRSQLPLLTVGDQPVWTPNFQQSPDGMLFGLPILAVEYLSKLGDAGDIVLADLSQYRLIEKGGVKAAGSMHVRFIYDEMAFRFTYRVDGQPIRRNALTPKSGGDTLTPFVGIAARA